MASRRVIYVEEQVHRSPMMKRKNQTRTVLSRLSASATAVAWMEWASPLGMCEGEERRSQKMRRRMKRTRSLAKAERQGAAIQHDERTILLAAVFTVARAATDLLSSCLSS